MLNGIDISNHQGGMNLKSVLAQNPTTRIVIVKASEGVSFVDANMGGFVDAALAKGCLVGIYHYARPERNTALAEAAFFLKYFQKYKGRAVPVLDWESPGASNVVWAEKWLDRVALATGSTPMFYTYESVENKYNFTPINKYPLWIAKYKDHGIDRNFDMGDAGPKPTVKHWSKYWMWQWTSAGRLKGYSGNLDCNAFYGTADDWNKWITGSKITTVKADPIDVTLQIAASQVGYKEGASNHTKYGDEMHDIQPSNMNKNAAWCDAFVDWCIYKMCQKFGHGAETARAVLCGDFDDYTYNSVALYKKAGRWSNRPSRGDQIFFGGAGHTGLVEKVESGKVYTIEGNKSDQVKRCSYSTSDSDIIGYGMPRYSLVGTVMEVMESEADMLPLLKKGSKGKAVEWLQIALGGLTVDGDFGDKTLVAVKAFQTRNGLAVDGEVGPKTWAAIIDTL